MLGFYEILPSSEVKTFFAKNICDSGRLQQQMCAAFFELLVGMKPGRIDPGHVSTFLSHSPGGASSKLCTHMAQIFRNGDRQGFIFVHSWTMFDRQFSRET